MKNLTKIVLLILVGFVFANSINAQVENPPFPIGAVRMPTGKEQPLENGVKLLKQINLANGGKLLDNVKTLRLKGRGHLIELSGDNLTTNLYYNLTVLIDLKKNRIRKEEDAGSNFFEIRQIEGESGWIFNPKQPRSISKTEQNELLKILETGSLGLRKNRLDEMEIYTIGDNKGFKYLAVKINGVKHLLGFDKKSHLLIDDYFENQEQHEITFDDFRKVKGITFPFYERQIIKEKESRTVKYWSIEVNPKLTEKDWAVPK